MPLATARAAGPNRRPSARRIELRLPSELGWERTAADLAASVATRMGFPPERVEDIKFAVGEATMNAIEHGNALDASRKVLIVLVPEGASLVIDVRDRSGTPFSPDPAGQRPNLEEKLAGAANTRGWGVFLIRQLVDEVEFSSTSDGNVVRMVVHLD